MTRTSVQPDGLELAEDPAVDLLDRLHAPLLDVGLDRGEEGRDGDAGEDERRGLPSTDGAAEGVGDPDPEHGSDERRDGPQIEPGRRRGRRRSRSWRRARRRRRRPEGTGRRADSGRRPGTPRRPTASIAPTSSPSATRGARSSQRIASSVSENGDSTPRNGTWLRTSRATAPSAEVDRPEREPEQASRRRRRRRRRAPSRTRRRAAPARAGRRDEPAGRRRPPLASSDSLERPRDQLDELDGARPPARGDVVVGLDDVRRSRPPRSGPSRGASRRSRPSGSQHLVSARTIRSGLSETMYSPDSCG